LLVIPAKAGIQGLNGIARFVRDSASFVARMERSGIREDFFRAAAGRSKDSMFNGQIELMTC